ncbi:hypothetical protein AVEN_173875-1 [Araneus ventricosus]|uniref:Uncharacterized protein n=1 Tax=Araneus ventricosus TaxID=182803 RepID=A0A4Y2HZX6_ARAVE|nr:hypothetical protein AVEN_173875-1 [Araneus ventricosus]
MRVAYADCPLDVRESLAVQFFVKAIKDEDTQLSTRLMDFTDLKSAFAYTMKYEAAKTASEISMHARSIKVEDNTGKEKDEKFKSLLGALEKLLGRLAAGKRLSMFVTILFHPWFNIHYLRFSFVCAADVCSLVAGEPSTFIRLYYTTSKIQNYTK